MDERSTIVYMINFVYYMVVNHPKTIIFNHHQPLLTTGLGQDWIPQNYSDTDSVLTLSSSEAGDHHPARCPGGMEEKSTYRISKYQ